MWPGPYGDLGSRKYLTASLDQSLRRLGVDYVDIFYHHRPDPDTPLEETMGALDSIVRAGKALYVGVSSYSGEHTARAAAILRDLGTPLVIHQPSYSMFNRWIETDLLDVLDRRGRSAASPSPPWPRDCSPTATWTGIPADSRAAAGKSLSTQMINDDNLARIRALNEIAAESRPDAGPAGAGLGAAEIHDDLDPDRRQQRAAAGGQRAPPSKLDFSDDELAAIDEHAVDSGVDLWAGARQATGRAERRDPWLGRSRSVEAGIQERALRPASSMTPVYPLLMRGS